MCMSDQGFESGRLCSEHGFAERQQAVEAPSLVGTAGVGDQPELDQASDGGIQRAGAEAECAFGPALDLLDDGIPMTVLARQGEQDMELMRRQRQKAIRIVHASNLDVSCFDVVGGGLVGSPSPKAP